MVLVDESAFPTTQYTSMPQIDIEWAPTSNPMDAPVWAPLAASKSVTDGSTTPTLLPSVEGLSITSGRSSELDQYQASKLTLELDDLYRYLDPTYTASPWYGSVIPNRQIRVTFRYNSVTYAQFTGFMDGLPRKYDRATTKVQIDATGPFKILAGIELVDQFEAQMRLPAAQGGSPNHWWRCSDLDNLTLQVADGGSAGTLYPGTVKYGAKLGGQPIRLGSAGSLSVDQPNGTDPGGDPLVAASVSARPAGASTLWSFEGWWQSTNPDTSHTAGLFTVGSTNNTSNQTVCLTLDYDTELLARLFNASVAVGSISATGAAYISKDSKVHQFVVTYSGTNTRFRLYVDGALAGTDSTGIPATFTFSSNNFVFGGSANVIPDAAHWWEGLFSDFAVWDGVELTAAQVLAHYNAGSNGFSGEGTGTRLGRVLDQSPWPAARRTIATGDVNVGVHATGGNLLEYAQLLARTESGEFLEEPDGSLLYRDGTALADETRSNTSQGTWGDGGGAELAYIVDSVVTDDSEANVINDASITREGGIVQRAYDAASREQNTWKVYSEQGSLDATDATALTRAQLIVSRRKDPKLRVKSFSVDPAYAPATLYPQVLGRRKGDRITFFAPNQDAPYRVSQDYWIDGKNLDVTFDDDGPHVVVDFQLVACS